MGKYACDDQASNEDARARPDRSARQAPATRSAARRDPLHPARARRRRGAGRDRGAAPPAGRAGPGVRDRLRWRAALHAVCSDQRRHAVPGGLGRRRIRRAGLADRPAGPSDRLRPPRQGGTTNRVGRGRHVRIADLLGNPARRCPDAARCRRRAAREPCCGPRCGHGLAENAGRNGRRRRCAGRPRKCGTTTLAQGRDADAARPRDPPPRRQAAATAGDLPQR
jgi:hypothetical protein